MDPLKPHSYAIQVNPLTFRAYDPQTYSYEDIKVDCEERRWACMQRLNVPIVPVSLLRETFYKPMMHAFSEIVNTYSLRLRGHAFYVSIVPYFVKDMTKHNLMKLMPKFEEKDNSSFLSAQATFAIKRVRDDFLKNLYIVSIIRHCSDNEEHLGEVEMHENTFLYSIPTKRYTSTSKVYVHYCHSDSSRSQISDVLRIHDSLHAMYIRSLLKYKHPVNLLCSWRFM